jgi:hypothetical protein
MATWVWKITENPTTNHVIKDADFDDRGRRAG